MAVGSSIEQDRQDGDRTPRCRHCRSGALGRPRLGRRRTGIPTCRSSSGDGASPTRAGRRRRGRRAGTVAGCPAWADDVVRDGAARRRRGRNSDRRRDGARRAHDPRPRPRLPARALPAPDAHRRGARGASCSANPAPDPTSPGSPPRAVRDGDEWVVNGPEGLEHQRAPRRSRHAARPHRLGRSQAPGHHVLRAADAPAGRRGSPAAADERPLVVQRGVPDRRPHPARVRRRRGRRRLARRTRPRSRTNGASAPCSRPAVRRPPPVARSRRRTAKPRRTSRRTGGTRSAPAVPISSSTARKRRA